jgi:hypothetical protein
MSYIAESTILRAAIKNMYIKDIVTIGGVSGSFDGREEFMNETNSIIKKVEKDYRGNLIATLAKIDSSLEGASHIKSIPDLKLDFDPIEKILNSKSILGKTLNDLMYMKIEEI